MARKKRRKRTITLELLRKITWLVISCFAFLMTVLLQQGIIELDVFLECYAFLANIFQ